MNTPTPIDWLEVARRIREGMDRKQLRACDLADNIDASRPQVSRWLNGKQPIPHEYLLSIGEELSFSIDWMLRGRNPMIDQYENDLMLYFGYLTSREKMALSALLKARVEFQMNFKKKE